MLCSDKHPACGFDTESDWTVKPQNRDTRGPAHLPRAHGCAGSYGHVCTRVPKSARTGHVASAFRSRRLRDFPHFSFHCRGESPWDTILRKNDSDSGRLGQSPNPAAHWPPRWPDLLAEGVRGRRRGWGWGGPGEALGTRSGPPSPSTQHAGAHTVSLRSWLKMCMFNHRNLFLSVKIVRQRTT